MLGAKADAISTKVGHRYFCDRADEIMAEGRSPNVVLFRGREMFTTGRSGDGVAARMYVTDSFTTDQSFSFFGGSLLHLQHQQFRP